MRAEQTLTCNDCDRRIEACACCEEESCGEAICYRCLITDLGEWLPQPHEHGG